MSEHSAENDVPVWCSEHMEPYCPRHGQAVENDERTHSFGVMCAVCKTVLVPDNCSCGNAHGYTYQEPNEWAARTWPDHPCFIPPEEKQQ